MNIRSVKPRSRTLKGKKWKCQCEICTKWSPMFNRIIKKLGPRDRKLLDEFRLKDAMQSDDLGAATAKLNGDWPGWEWMKQAVKDHIEMQKDW